MRDRESKFARCRFSFNAASIELLGLHHEEHTGAAHEYTYNEVLQVRYRIGLMDNVESRFART